MNQKKDIKCVIIGDSGVGKTSLLITRTTKVFPEDAPKLLELEKTTVTSAGREYTLHLWDTTWEQGYTRLCSLWYPHTDVFLFCFSIESWDSMDRVRERWCPEILHLCPGVPFVLVGLKTDLRDDSDTMRELERRDLGPVKLENAANLAKDLMCPYVECSAKHGEGVDRVFEEALAAALKPRKAARKSRCRVL
ncbi:ras-related protein ced-10 [Aspergillus keveii]|uniref:Ras-related protein ced-10 n=1 Tax=Aspergillus keveii TaxID=714993 RepID=A0ABR4GKV2_9EURO